MNNIVSIISKAKQYINTFGWIQGDYGNPTEGFCMVGAIRAAVDVTDDREYNLPPELLDVYKAFTKPLIRRGIEPYRYSATTINEEITLKREPFADAANLIDYNDEGYVKQIDIIELFDDALEEASKAA